MAGAQQDVDGEITDINVTPLVDVCLVLVIIFMAVAPFAIQAGIKVLESKSKAAEGKTSASENVQIKITADGRVSLNGKVIEAGQLDAVLRAALDASKDKMVILTADAKNRVGEVVEVLDTARQAGALKLAIMKEEGPAAPAPAPEEAQGT